jgi:hypothetical protein
MAETQTTPTRDTPGPTMPARIAATAHRITTTRMSGSLSAVVWVGIFRSTSSRAACTPLDVSLAEAAEKPAAVAARDVKLAPVPLRDHSEIGDLFVYQRHGVGCSSHQGSHVCTNAVPHA